MKQNNTFDDSNSVYNNKNTLLQAENLNKLLNEYNIDIVNDINIYRSSFVNKSYITKKNDNFISGNINCPKDCMPLQEISNERYEFLGDSILNTCVAKYLFDRYPQMNEGFLTNMRTKLVNGNMLAKLSKTIGLEKYVIISKQLEDSNARENKNILEDTFESFIAAIYIDNDIHNNGFKYASKWIISVLETHIDFSELVQNKNNAKDTLLKYCQFNFNWQPKFYETNIHDEHNKRIHTVAVKDNKNDIIGVGKANNRKNAEIEAAKKALFYFGQLN